MSLTEQTYTVKTDDGFWTVTKWYNELGWIQTDVRTPWVPCFALFPKKSKFTYNRIWGKAFRRDVKYMCNGSGHDPVDRDKEYATAKEVFEDKLKGAA